MQVYWGILISYGCVKLLFPNLQTPVFTSVLLFFTWMPHVIQESTLFKQCSASDYFLAQVNRISILTAALRGQVPSLPYFQSNQCALSPLSWAIDCSLHRGCNKKQERLVWSMRRGVSFEEVWWVLWWWRTQCGGSISKGLRRGGMKSWAKFKFYFTPPHFQ